MKTIFYLFLSFVLCFSSFFPSAYATPSNTLSQDLHFPITPLQEKVSRKEFVETLFVWYPLYKEQKTGKPLQITFPEIDKKYFKDVDLESDFGKKLRFLVGQKAFQIQPYFSGKDFVDQDTFFIVMKRLGVFQNRASCISLKICEIEMDQYSPFVKASYYRYVDKILNKNLRKTLSSPKDFWQAGYRPALAPSYKFPLKPQTLNGCYAFTVRNILTYKYNLGVRVPEVENFIKKDPKNLWYPNDKANFNNAIGIQATSYTHIETLFTSLQAGEPLSVSYLLEYNSKGVPKTVGHVVAAYSFDEQGVWVAETYSNTRKRIPYEKIFNTQGKLLRNPFQKFHFGGVDSWNEKQKSQEKKYNFLAGEH